jgi:hypothetical protein
MAYTNKNLGNVLHSGWGDLEDGFFWSTSRYSSIIIPVKKQVKKIGIQMTVEPFLVTGKLGEQNVEIYCNGLLSATKTLTDKEQEIIYFEVHPSVCAFGTLKFDFIFANSISPRALAISEDRRTLAIKLFELDII